MNSKILTKKPTIKVNNESYIDLSYNSLSSDALFDSLLGIEIVDERTEMRIDLICKKWYGNSDNIGILLKANNIFNPYSIKIGDFLIIPSLKSDSATYKPVGTIKKSEVREQFTDTDRLSANDISRLKAIAASQVLKKNQLKNPLPPNVLSQGVTNKKFEDGQIILTNHH